jgi:CheY-like chemotaxis protein
MWTWESQDQRFAPPNLSGSATVADFATVPWGDSRSRARPRGSGRGRLLEKNLSLTRMEEALSRFYFDAVAVRTAPGTGMANRLLKNQPCKRPPGRPSPLRWGFERERQCDASLGAATFRGVIGSPSCPMVERGRRGEKRVRLQSLPILIVEDERTITLTLSYLLRKAGYDVSACADVEDAKRLSRGQRFFLVLVDLVLSSKGQLDGLEIVHLLKSTSPETRVMVMTAHGNPEVKRTVMQVGADSFWDKPLDMRRLLEEIHRLEPGNREE